MKRGSGEEHIEYLAGRAEKLHPILAETHGTIIYQEQVMMIAREVAGFSLAEADILRAAMGKKDQVKMAQQRDKFLRRAIDNGTGAHLSEPPFHLLPHFPNSDFTNSPTLR